MCSVGFSISEVCHPRCNVVVCNQIVKSNKHPLSAHVGRSMQRRRTVAKLTAGLPISIFYQPTPSVCAVVVGEAYLDHQRINQRLRPIHAEREQLREVAPGLPRSSLRFPLADSRSAGRRPCGASEPPRLHSPGANRQHVQAPDIDRTLSGVDRTLGVGKTLTER